MCIPISPYNCQTCICNCPLDLPNPMSLRNLKLSGHKLTYPSPQSLLFLSFLLLVMISLSKKNLREILTRVFSPTPCNRTVFQYFYSTFKCLSDLSCFFISITCTISCLDYGRASHLLWLPPVSPIFGPSSTFLLEGPFQKINLITSLPCFSPMAALLRLAQVTSEYGWGVGVGGL